MIARTWTTGIDPARANEYDDFAREVSLPMFRSQPGFCGVLMSRGENLAEVVSLWSDQEAVDALGSSARYLETVCAIERAGFLQGAQTTRCHKLHLIDLAGLDADRARRE